MSKNELLLFYLTFAILEFVQAFKMTIVSLFYNHLTNTHKNCFPYMLTYFLQLMYHTNSRLIQYMMLLVLLMPWRSKVLEWPWGTNQKVDPTLVLKGPQWGIKGPLISTKTGWLAAHSRQNLFVWFYLIKRIHIFIHPCSKWYHLQDCTN